MTAATRRQLDLITGFERVRVAVAGDLIADEFIYGQIDRVSREAPVLILSYDSAEVLPGGAGNAARNAASLGARRRGGGSRRARQRRAAVCSSALQATRRCFRRRAARRG